MYDPKTGAYCLGPESFPHESEYRFDTTYYIKYNCKKALFALDRLGQITSETPDGIFISHVYLDLLFEAVGQVINRFIDKRRGSHNDGKAKQIQMNVKEYDFSSVKYPLLSDSTFRNHIEHIDEKDQVLIEAGQYRGTYNVILPLMDLETKCNLTDSNRRQNNLLNLQDMTYMILASPRTLKSESQSITVKTINLVDLKKELSEIFHISEQIWDCIADPLL